MTVQPICVGPGHNPNCWFSHPQAQFKEPSAVECIALNEDLPVLQCLEKFIQVLNENDSTFKATNSFEKFTFSPNK